MIGVEHQVAASHGPRGGEGAGQHQQGGFGQVKIGQQDIHRLETIRRMDEQPGPAPRGHDLARVPGGHRFKHPQRGRAHRHHPPSLAPGGDDGRRRVRSQLEILLVHGVRRQILRFHGRESAGTDMQGDKAGAHPQAPEGRQQFRGEMQAGRGRGHRSRLRGKHRLIAFPILGIVISGRALDVRRQGDLAQLVEARPHIGHALEAQAAAALVVFLDHLGAHRGRPSVQPMDPQLAAGPDPFGGAEQGRPVVEPVFLQQQELELPARVRFHPAQPGGNDPAVVEHEQIAGAQPGRQLIKSAMPHHARGSLEHQQTGLIPARRGGLGDPFRRQIIVEIRGLQKTGLSGRRPAPRANLVANLVVNLAAKKKLATKLRSRKGMRHTTGRLASGVPGTADMTFSDDSTLGISRTRTSGVWSS